MDRNRTLSRLRDVQPSKVIAIVDDEPVTVAIGRSGQRGRWERAADAIGKLEASSVQLLDGDNAVIEIIADEDDASATAIAIPSTVSQEERALLAAERIAALVVRTSETARESVLRESRASSEAYVELLRLVVGRVSQLESVYSKVLQAQYAATIAQAEASSNANGDSETEKMVSSMLPLLAAKLGAGLQ